MKRSISKIAISLALISGISTSIAYAAIRSAPLNAKKTLTYLSRMLLNPTDGTDGTVKKAVSLTQSCKTGEVMQGFGPTWNLICAPRTVASTIQQNQNAPASQKPAGNSEGLGCVTVEDMHSNEMKSYTMLCNARSGKVCVYTTINDPGNGQWSCDNPKGFEASPTEAINCSGYMSRFNQQVSYDLYCTLANQGKICSYEVVSDASGKLSSSEWKCGKVAKPEVMAEFNE